MTSHGTHINGTTGRAGMFTALLSAVVLLPIALTIGLLAVAATPPRGIETDLDEPWELGEGSATAGLKARQNDPLAIEAFFGRESYRPGTTATLQFASSLSGVRLQV